MKSLGNFSFWAKWRFYLYRSFLAFFFGQVFLWTEGVIWFCISRDLWLRICLTLLFIIFNILILCFYKQNRKLLWVYTGITILIWCFCLRIHPSNNRDWQDSWSRIPNVEIKGDSILIKNIRDFHYRTQNDFDVRYIDRTYRLSQLKGLDLILSNWGIKEIVHVMLSFDFGEDGHLALSAETRLEKGEPQDFIAGLFRQFEILYILGTEDDLLKLRSHIRKENLYVYRTTSTELATKQIFLNLALRINQLHQKPEFYNPLTYNCMFSLFPSLYVASKDARWNVHWIKNGSLDRIAYKKGVLECYKNETFVELKQRCLVTGRVGAISDTEDYATIIRKVISSQQSSPKNNSPE